MEKLIIFLNHKKHGTFFKNNVDNAINGCYNTNAVKI